MVYSLRGLRIPDGDEFSQQLRRRHFSASRCFSSCGEHPLAKRFRRGLPALHLANVARFGCRLGREHLRFRGCSDNADSFRTVQVQSQNQS